GAAGSRILLAQQQAKRRRLPRARRPDDEDELTLADVERDVAQRDDVALIGLGDTFESNHRRPSSEADRERFEQRAAGVLWRRLAAPSVQQGDRTRGSQLSGRPVPPLRLRRCAAVALPAPLEVRLDERVELAVEDGLD